MSAQEVFPLTAMNTPRSPRFKVLIVLPAYNEEENIGGLLESLSEALDDASLDYRIIVVDDGSKDRTWEILERHKASIPLDVYRHEVNLGLGATIRDGLYYANQTANPKDVVITMDADETHLPGLILRMVRMVKEGHGVVIASRYQPGSRVIGLALHRRLISYLASWLMRILFHTPGVRDFTCGYRAYSGSILRQAISEYGSAFVDQQGFQCMVDILLKLRRLPHVVFGEAPMILRYDLKKGNSKMRLMQTSVHTLKLLVWRKLGK